MYRNVCQGRRYFQYDLSSAEYYEQYVRGEISRELLRSALDPAHEAKAVLAEVTEDKEVCERGYLTFRKLLSGSDKRIPLSEIMDCIDRIMVDNGKHIVVEWGMRD